MTYTFQPNKLNRALKGNKVLCSVYDDIARMPRWLRPAFFKLAGLPRPGEPIARFNPFVAVVRDLAYAGLFGATAATFAAAAAAGIALPLTGLVALYASLGVAGRLRRASVGHTHEAGHGVVADHLVAIGWPRTKAERASNAIMEGASLFSLTKNGKDYRDDHNEHHDPRFLGTELDPDGRDLKEDGFWRGEFATKKDFYGKLAMTLIDPLWHARKLKARLHSNLVRGSARRRVLAAFMLAGLASAALVLPFPVWLAAIGLPWTVFYNLASLLQVLTKHTYGHGEGAPKVADQARRCHERIPYHLMPKARDAGMLDWLKWGAKIALIDIPARLAVLDTSMIGHGWHHLAWPAEREFHDWTNTVPRMMAYRSEQDPKGNAATPVLLGYETALERQARFMIRS